MILNQITIEDILERYDMLPDELLDILEDASVENIVSSICKKNNIIKPEWIDAIKQLTTFVLMGFIHYYDLGAEINLALNSTNSKLGTDIANEISLKIFEPIKTLLEKNYSPLKPKEPGIDFFDQILKELQKIKSDSENIQSFKTTLEQQPSIQIPKPEKDSLISLKDLYQTNKPSSNINIKETKVEAIKINKNEESSKPIKTSQEINTASILKPEVKLDNFKKDDKIPSPKFIFQHEEEPTPIKTSGIENKIPLINMSKINPPPPPPQKAEIEIGTKTEKNIKVVNYSTLNENEKSNQFKNVTPPPPPPPSPPK